MPFSKTLDRLAKTDDRYHSYEFRGDDEETNHALYLNSGWSAASDPGNVHFGSGRTVKECREAEPLVKQRNWNQFPAFPFFRAPKPPEPRLYR